MANVSYHFVAVVVGRREKVFCMHANPFSTAFGNSGRLSRTVPIPRLAQLRLSRGDTVPLANNKKVILSHKDKCTF